jgi:hypothetical protein
MTDATDAKEGNSGRDIWRRVVQLVQMEFTDQRFPRSFGVEIPVQIRNGVPDQYRGIALLEVTYKLVSTIINRRLSNKIEYHQAVHGFL